MGAKLIEFKVTGSFNNTEAFLKKMSSPKFRGLDNLARQGVDALASHTPVETGLTAESWDYEIEYKKDSTTISWINTNAPNGIPIAVILQYGHGTGTGGYVEGIDYINPAIKPIFDEIAQEVWKVVTSA